MGAKKVFNTGENLVTLGERGNCAYIIEKGQVEILIERDGQMVQIGTRGPGALIGEMAMVDDQPRVATVRAVEDCEVMEITRDDFSHRLDGADPVLKMVMRVILTRYRDMLMRSIISARPPNMPKPEDIESSDAAYAQAVDTLKISTDLRKALENEELSLHYQPLIHAGTGRIAGYEALMRWNHPQKGNIPPNIFIPVAEEIDLIIEMSRWALSEAATAIKMLQAAAPKISDEDAPLFMSVNMSVRDVAHPDFFTELDRILNAKSVKSGSMHLEVTEGVLIENPESARETLEKCHARGLGISLDDFGTGYSSLSYLHYFPIDTLKIDQSFIRAMLEQEKSMELVRSIIGLAKNLRMTVIAEGIETKEQATAVKAHGCDFFQGFLFSRPVPLAQAIDLTKNWKPALV